MTRKEVTENKPHLDFDLHRIVFQNDKGYIKTTSNWPGFQIAGLVTRAETNQLSN